MNARPDPVLVAALLALTFSTGIIDAVSFLALGQVFTANMTGNVALLGFAAFSPELSLPRSLTALVVFLAGAMAGGRLAASSLARASARAWIALAFAWEAALLAACALAAYGHASPVVPERDAYLLIVLLAFAMGLRNATVRRIGIRDLATTVVTSSLADLGMTIAVREGPGHWKRATASALLMLAGAGVGALMLRVSVALPLAASTVIAVACAAATRASR